MRYFFSSIVLAVVLLSSINSLAQDTLAPPNQNGPTKVYVSILINNISEINAVTQVMKADMFLVARWKDTSLAHPGKRKVISLSELKWDPLLTIINRLNISKSFPDDVTVLSDGTVVYIQRLFGEFMQDFHLKDFPMDKQKLEVRIIAIGFSSSEIELLPDPDQESGFTDKLVLRDWELLNWKMDNTPYEFIEGKGSVPSVALVFEMKRESGFYILIYIIPLVLIIMMSWSVFWLSPTLSSSQISIATTSMLTLIAYRFIVIGNLPKISYLTRMDIFVLCSSFLIFMTLLQAVINSSLVYRKKEEVAERIDKKCRIIFPVLYIIISFVAFVL